MRALELIVDNRLGASLNAGDVVAHGVHARLARVDLDDDLEGRLAALKLLLPVLAVRFALVEHLRLGVLTGLQLRLDVAVHGVVGKMRSEVRSHLHPAGREPSCDTASHFLIFIK